MLRLLRPLNLLIIILIMYLVRYCLIQTQLQLQVLDLQMEDIDFALLTLSVVFIAAAGYIINDVFDVDIDAINKPGSVLIGGKISRKFAMSIYMVLNVLGLLLGLYVSNTIGFYQLAIIHLLTIGLLWFYSTVFKRLFLLGNIIISILSAIVIFMPILFEPARGYVNSTFILGFGIFAFLLTFMREIIKDSEDVEGDNTNGCRTLPVVIGIKSAKIAGATIGMLVALLLVFVQYMQFKTHDYWSFWYFTIAIQLPLFILISQTLKATTKEDFHKASSLSKFVMLTGILSMLVFKYTL